MYLEIGGFVFPRLAHRVRLAAVGTVAVAALGLTACTGGTVTATAGDVNTVSADFAGSIDAAVESAMQLSQSTEAVVGVWSKDGDYVRGFGGEDVSGSTRFHGTEASQPVVCALLLDSVQRGELDLDDPVSQALPRQSGIEEVTFRQLCEMRSGLADYKPAYTDIFVNNPTRPWPEQELIAEGLSASPLSAPGTEFHNSDTNAVLLGRALRVNAGLDFNEMLKDRVLNPAKMPSSYSPAVTETVVKGNALTPITFPSSGGAPVCDAGVIELEGVSASMLGNAGATVTTVTDLKNFYTKFLSGGFGGGKIVTEAQFTTTPAEGEEPAADGPQWAFGTEKVGSLFGRAGAVTGTLSAAYHDPASGYTVVVALNNSSAGERFVRALALEIAAISAAAGQGPEVNWSAEDQAAVLAETAVCQAPAEEAPAEEAPAE